MRLDPLELTPEVLCDEIEIALGEVLPADLEIALERLNERGQLVDALASVDFSALERGRRTAIGARIEKILQQDARLRAALAERFEELSQSQSALVNARALVRGYRPEAPRPQTRRIA